MLRMYNNLHNRKGVLIYFINNIGSTFKTLLFVIKIINISRWEKQQLFWLYFLFRSIRTLLNATSTAFAGAVSVFVCRFVDDWKPICDRNFRTFPFLLYGQACALSSPPTLLRAFHTGEFQLLFALQSIQQEVYAAPAIISLNSHVR